MFVIFEFSLHNCSYLLGREGVIVIRLLKA